MDKINARRFGAVWALFVILGVFNAIDIYTTYVGVVEQGAFELNPLVRWAFSTSIEPLGALVTVKVLSMLGTAAAVYWLLRKGLVTGTIRTLFIVDYIMAAVVIWNTTQITGILN